MLDALKVAVPALVLLLCSLVAILVQPENPEPVLSCITGEAAVNPTQTGPDGESFTMPANRRFDTVEAAERWICLDVPQAALPPGWELEGVIAERSTSLESFRDGKGFRMLTIAYHNESLDTGVMINTPAPFGVNGAGTPHEIEVQGETGTLWLRGDRPLWVIQWGEGEATVVARGTTRDIDIERDIIPLLETIR